MIDLRVKTIPTSGEAPTVGSVVEEKKTIFIKQITSGTFDVFASDENGKVIKLKDISGVDVERYLAEHSVEILNIFAFSDIKRVNINSHFKRPGKILKIKIQKENGEILTYSITDNSTYFYIGANDTFFITGDSSAGLLVNDYFLTQKGKEEEEISYRDLDTLKIEDKLAPELTVNQILMIDKSSRIDIFINGKKIESQPVDSYDKQYIIDLKDVVIDGQTKKGFTIRFEKTQGYEYQNLEVEVASPYLEYESTTVQLGVENTIDLESVGSFFTVTSSEVDEDGNPISES